MELLKVGDKVCYVKHGNTYGQGRLSYTFDEVTKLTKTLAILKSGIRLLNKSIKRQYTKNDEYYFATFGRGVYRTYEIVTDKLLQEYEFHKKYCLAKSWFQKHIFTNEQIIEIFEKYAQKEPNS